MKSPCSQKPNTSRNANLVRVLRCKNGRPVVEERALSEVEKVRADEIVLRLTLSKAQSERIAILAKMLSTTPETLAIAKLFSDFDAWGSWNEFVEGSELAIERYAETELASTAPAGTRIEDEAPERLKKVAGYVSPEVASAQEVAR